MDPVTFSIIAVPLIVAAALLIYLGRASAAPSAAPATAAPAPVVEQIRNCIRDEAEKTRQHAQRCHDEAQRAVEALHGRADRAGWQK